MNKRYAAAAKFAAAALFSILAVVLAASIFVMIVSANERYRVAGDFAQFQIQRKQCDEKDCRNDG